MVASLETTVDVAVLPQKYSAHGDSWEKEDAMKALKNLGDVITPVRLQLMVSQDDADYPYDGWGAALSHAYYGEHLTNWDSIVLSRLHLRLFASWDDAIQFVYDSRYADGHSSCEMSPVDEMHKYLDWMRDNEYDFDEAVSYFEGYLVDKTNPYTRMCADDCLHEMAVIEYERFNPFAFAV